jgi:BirA family biotin operon repressor/biotin-[acetyl-CoA-carboxylase] ligase
VNVNWSADPPDGGISLDRLAGRPVDREELLVAYLLELDGLYSHLVRTLDPGPIASRHRAMSATLGRRVRIDVGSEQVDGTAVDLLPDGRLVVATHAGDTRVFATGDVVHLRPVP